VLISFLLFIGNIVSSFLFPSPLSEPKTVLITGASSGIGKALSLQYARKGVTLILLGRDKSRLQETANLCTKEGATVITKTLDLTDREALKEFLVGADERHHIDLVIANAGVNSETLGKGSTAFEEHVYELYDVNIYGVLNTITPLIPRFKARRQGQISIVSSLMAYVITEGAYASSKACATHMGHCLRVELAPYNVQVNVIAPPYVPTPMTVKRLKGRRNFMIMDADDFAVLVQKQISENRAIVSHFIVYALSWLYHLLPPTLLDVVSQIRVHLRARRNAKKAN